MTSKKITMKVDEAVVVELKKLVPPKKDYSYTIKMLIDHYNSSSQKEGARGPAPSKWR